MIKERSENGQKAGGLQDNTYLGKFSSQKIKILLKSTSKELSRFPEAHREVRVWLTCSVVCLVAL